MVAFLEGLIKLIGMFVDIAFWLGIIFIVLFVLFCIVAVLGAASFAATL